MGGHEYRGSSYTYDSRDSYTPEPPTLVEKLEGECGIKAIVEICGNDLWIEDLLGDDECGAILRGYEKGLGIGDLIKLACKVDSEFRPDMRYNSQKRDLAEGMFQSNHKGLVAVKFKDSNASHWLPVVDGGLVDEDDLLTSKKFDGFGHRVVFQNEVDAGCIENTYSVACKGPCDLCFRATFCRFLKRESNNNLRSVKF